MVLLFVLLFGLFMMFACWVDCGDCLKCILVYCFVVGLCLCILGAVWASLWMRLDLIVLCSLILC